MLSSFACKCVDLLVIYIHKIFNIKIKLLSLIVVIELGITRIYRWMVIMEALGLIIWDLIGWAAWFPCVRAPM